MLLDLTPARRGRAANPRSFAGLMAGNLGVASAMMADITPPENRARGMGMIGAAFGVGFLLGPAHVAASAELVGEVPRTQLAIGLVSNHVDRTGL